MLRDLLRRSRRRPPVVLDAADAYGLWAPAYPPRAHNRLMELEQEALLSLLPDVRGLVVLDLGCGSGRYARLLGDLGVARVIGVDRSAAMLGRARGAIRLLVRGDARALALADASIDIAVCGLMVGDLAHLDAVLTEAARALRPGGCLVYSDLHLRGAVSGWQRTFTGADGERYAVRHHVHGMPDHLAACRRAGLEPEQVAEPLIDGDHPDRGQPAALVVRARRRP
jgi:malonyl-CoA O-methyltransferase